MNIVVELVKYFNIYLIIGMKTAFWISHIGVVMCIVGEVMRKSAMFTAKSNFNHHVSI